MPPIPQYTYLVCSDKALSFFYGNGVIQMNPKVAKNTFENKAGHEYSKELIYNERKAIEKNLLEKKSLIFNGEKAICYFSENDPTKLKLIPSDYASKRASDKLEKEAYLRPHRAAGVIIALKTSDKKVVFGSRDANRDKGDKSKYPLQFPCGFLDIDKNFYQEIKSGDNPNFLPEQLVKNGIRESREEILNFDEKTITNSQILGIIFQTLPWQTKQEGKQKNVNVICSFVIGVEVAMTAEEILAKRNAEIILLENKISELEKLGSQLSKEKQRELKELQNAKKDFDEISQLGFLNIEEIDVLLKNEKKINFDGRDRNFVAEHGITLDIMRDFWKTNNLRIGNSNEKPSNSILEPKQKALKSSKEVSQNCK